MTTATRLGTHITDREAEKGRVALQGFLGITSDWDCSTEERTQLLGGVSRATLNNYRKLKPTRLSRDTMERVSYVMGIYKAVRVMYPTAERAHRRIRLGSTDFPFSGKSPMEFMAQGSIRHLLLTRRYFDAKRGWA
ncbi:antitoxin Xre-like helix-turn-helix domain-containing protein [Marinobacter sp. ELB17]|uniref:antitoxin Xre-like helix-turn-helix domain-containing protein n=1 Tax=Marinobacter sp. ELB17 TaxID=270374 RepID=UPI0000F380DE|nr:antitoxin Xre-like helix-turn-helix domain-containing protein [Marinobacter sp. ELB17]EAZ96993.1 hypothetical protein MELB17_00015 [Marinobacter sp. ELB17]